MLGFFRFHKLMRNEPFVHVHISNLAAQTGVTRFSQIHDGWKYSKNESLTSEQLQEYTHLLLEAKSKYSTNLKAFSHTHVILDSIEAFSHITVNYKIAPPVRIKTKPAIFILERKDFREYPHGKIIDSSVTTESVDSDEDLKDEVINVVNYDYETNSVEKEDQILDDLEQGVEDEQQDINENEKEVEQTIENVNIESQTIVEETLAEIDKEEPLAIAKQSFDELKTMRQERKKKAIAKIKSETRKEVVASAKEKLKEIMKRHKHIAEELSDSIVSNTVEKPEFDKSDITETDGRGDIPDFEDGRAIPESADGEDNSELNDIEHNIQDSLIVPDLETQGQVEIPEPEPLESVEDLIKSKDESHINENIDVIVEEVITRLIDRKIYDDKTKPEDIKAEDRQIIQRIVEEVVLEKMNYSKRDSK